MGRGRGRKVDCRIWAYVADDRPCGGTGPPVVAYVYAPDRKGICPARHLAAFRGTLQADGYSGFRALTAGRNDGAVTLDFCWAHLRRRFHKVHAHTASPIAAEVLLRIGALDAVEREIRSRTNSVEREIRPVVVTRKAALFAGSDELAA